MTKPAANESKNEKNAREIKNSLAKKAIPFAIMAATITVYSLFFDILIPNLQNDSYRAAVGSFFIIPIILLVIGQTGLGMVIFYLFSKSYSKANLLSSAIMASLMNLWFSLTYAIFPKYGPFYYIVFVYGEAPWYALPVELAWTIGALAIGTICARKILHLDKKRSFFAAVIVYTIMTLAAS
jgi:hypothetical protein